MTYKIDCNDCKVEYRTEENQTACELCGSTNITKTEV